MNKKSEIPIELLRRMKLIRMVEETIAERYSENKMRCPVHLCTGQEAVSAASGLVLRRDDFAVSSHRGHGHFLGKQGNLNSLIAEIYGKATGCSAGRGGSMHLIDKSVGFMGSTAIVGGTIPIGVGLGLSIELHGTDQVSCVFLGDGAIEEGVFYESVNFAVLRKLPVLFICENNLYSVYSPLKIRQPEGRRIYKMVEGLGCRTGQGDGNDVEAVYQKVLNAVRNIRLGKGPYFLEFLTYRWREHCGPNFDNDLGYRTNQEYLKWKKRDPILLYERKLLRRKAIDKATILAIDSDIKRTVDTAFVFAESSPFPSPDELTNGVYTD
ncbi:MAG: thiamine pyrophosphate-dependent dehydrogenase E1 component subunit alpha [Candidatus Omnitrophica bacterium]|nr:thiamine pyrophosphate-dependent dehydrogenase E1 component subunit alpha [Candidatus Omnitrophota bacterium]